MSETNITPFDAAEYLDSEKAIAAYLADAFDSMNDDVMLAALRDVAKARGMSRVAADAGVQRESLYKSLAEGAKPRFDTIVKLVGALGVKLVIEPSAVQTIVEAIPARRVSQAPKAAKASKGGKRTGGTARHARSSKAVPA